MLDLKNQINALEQRLKRASNYLKEDVTKKYNIFLELFKLNAIKDCQSFSDDQIPTVLSQLMVVICIERLSKLTSPKPYYYLSKLELKRKLGDESEIANTFHIAEAFQETILDMAPSFWAGSISNWKPRIEEIGISQSIDQSNVKMEALVNDIFQSIVFEESIEGKPILQDYVSDECNRRFLRTRIV